MIGLLTGFAVMVPVVWLAWRAGQDTEQRRAYETISTLRLALSRERLEVDRLRDRNARLGEILAARTPARTPVPEWIDRGGPR